MHNSVVSSRNGASAISKANDANPRQLIIGMIEADPKASKETLFDTFRSEIEIDDRMRRAVEWYFFINMYEYAVTTRSRGRDAGAYAQQHQRAREEAIVRQAEIVGTIKRQLAMLDLVMPNEKLMRDCTGAEMAKFGNRYKSIADRVGKQALVGSVLTEEQVKEIIDS